MLKSLKITCLLLLLSIFSFAQTAPINEERTADLMRSNGKIYVVVAVLVTILLGLFIYLWRLDKKITTIEKSNNEPELFK